MGVDRLSVFASRATGLIQIVSISADGSTEHHWQVPDRVVAERMGQRLQTKIGSAARVQLKLTEEIVIRVEVDLSIGALE